VLVKENLGAQILQQLREELMAGFYEPGQKLKLRDIAARFGVSVTPVREALGRLVSEQALVQLDHRSVCVPVMDLARYDEVRDLRLELEGLAAARAAECGAPGTAAALREIHARLVAARAQGCAAAIMRENERFHRTVCEAAGMPMLRQLVETLWLQCGPLMHGMTRWPVARPAQHPHLDLIAAVQARDGARAREAMRRDILMSTDALRQYLAARMGGAEEGPGAGWAPRLAAAVATVSPASGGA